MEDLTNTMSGRSLPGIHQITGALFPCSRIGCTTYCASQDELDWHERSCPHKRPSFASQQMSRIPPQPYRLQTQFGGHSSASSVDGDSDGSSTVQTPGSSRAPSMAPYPQIRRQSGVIRTEKGRARHRTSITDGIDGSVEQYQDEFKRTKKMNKEKANRSDQSAVIQRGEDFLACYVGWCREEQSGGNGNAAGVKASKITIQHAMEGALYKMLHRERVRAMQEDRVAEWEAEMREILDEVSVPGRDHFGGTFLTGEQETCYHEDKSKSCKLHGHPDWRECRLAHRQQRFEVNQKGFLSRVWGQSKQHTKALPLRAANTFPGRL